MNDLDTNLKAVFAGIRNAIGVPALLLFSAMTGFGSLAQEQGLSLYISMLSTVLIWGMPGQVVHVELYGLGAPLIAVVLGVAGANARFMPMTISMMPVFAESTHNRKWNYLFSHFISINTWAEMLNRGHEIRAERRVSYFLGFSQKPVENVNLVLGSFLFGLQILCFGFLADLVVKLNRNIIEILNKKNKSD